MKKFAVLAVAAFIAAPIGAQAQGGSPTSCSDVSAAATSPFALLYINGQCNDLSRYILPVLKGKTWGIDSPTLDLGAASVKLSALYNNDPFITFGLTTTNLGGSPITFAFLFGTPIVPGLYNVATSTGGVSVTNGARGTATVSNSSIYPSFISGYGAVGFFPTNLGVDIGTTPCVASGTPFTVTTTCTQGPGANSFAPTFYDGLQALVTYTQDDLGSVASWSGAVTIDATVVPEPASFALMTAGLILIGGFASRRRRN